MIEVRKLRKAFDDFQALDGVDMHVGKGNIYGLVGPNGAGKTTTIRILMDVFHADSGEILLDGTKFVPAKHQIGYLPEERGLYPKRTVMDQMVYLACLRGMRTKEARENAVRWLERLEVGEYASRKLETLSKGNQQKVQLASTLVCNPDIVILDEPFSGLDPVNSQILKDVVSELIAEGRLVIFSSHQMSYVEEFCDNIAVINQGKVVLDGELREIKREYGRNRLMLAAENYSMEALAEKTRREWDDCVSIVGQKKEFLILELKGDTDRRRFMERLVRSDVEVEKFGGYEPSLNDIFVSKVGEEI